MAATPPKIVKKPKHLTAPMLQNAVDRAIVELRKEGYDPKVHVEVHGDRVEVNAWPK